MVVKCHMRCYIVSFHSLYSDHKYNQYTHLLSEKDHNMLKWLKLFNKYDLYTKSDVTIDDGTKEYYNQLIYKYFEIIYTEKTILKKRSIELLKM